jgi:hypothetical protein
MAQFSETADITRPPEDVWTVLGERERWFASTAARMREEVEVRVTRSEAPTLLEEAQHGKTFARRVRYSLSPATDGTLLRVEDNIVFKGLGKLAAPIASRDAATAGRPRSSG